MKISLHAERNRAMTILEMVCIIVLTAVVLFVLNPYGGIILFSVIFVLVLHIYISSPKVFSYLERFTALPVEVIRKCKRDE